MKKRTKKRFLTFATAILAGLLMSHGLIQLANDAYVASTAWGELATTAKIIQSTAKADDSGVVGVDIEVQGAANSKVSVTYRTLSGTAIENIDYVGVNTTVDLRTDLSGYATHHVAIKSLNDSSTREKLRVYSGEQEFGRYFTISLISVDGGVVNEERKSCKCFLEYDYRVQATVGIKDTMLSREVAYLNDYSAPVSKYHKGDNDISGREHWRTWNEGVSFNNDTTRRWVNTYINPGFASAYGSYVIETIDDDKIHSETNIHMLSGNKEFIDKYYDIKNVGDKKNLPGLSLYYEIEPCRSGGDQIDGKAMYYISKNINPWDKDDDLVDLEELNKISDKRQRLYWIQKEKAWFSGANSIYDSMFYKTDPYNGVLDYGLSIYNGNKSWDREVHNIWMFLMLVDNNEPIMTRRYVEFDPVSDALRIYLRFNEPVYSSKKGSMLTFYLNDYNTKLYADYKEGNYSDTLVYEYPKASSLGANITGLRFELPNADIGDMAYNLDAFRVVRNNLLSDTSTQQTADLAGGNLDLSKADIVFSKEYPSTSPRAVHNVMISTNGEGTTSFSKGTVYYSWTDSDTIANPQNPASYAYSHILTSEEQGSFSVTLSKASGLASGSYYLHVLVVSPYGMTKTASDGPYVLDGDAPSINFVAPTGTNNTLLRKNYVVKVTKKGTGTSIAEVNALITYQDENDETLTNTYNMVHDGAVTNDFKQIALLNDPSILEEGYEVFAYRSNIDENDTSVPQDSLITALLGARSRLPIEIAFEIVDSAGNRNRTNPFSTVYDLRTLFEHNIDVADAYHLEDSIDDQFTIPVYDISGASESVGFTFTLPDGIEKDEVTKAEGAATYRVIVNGDQVFEDQGGVEPTVVVSGLKPGYYEAIGTITGGDPVVNKVSDSFAFYLTDGKDDPTTNKEKASGNLVLTNRTYQLNDAKYYYFRSTDTTVQSLSYGAKYDSSISKWQGGSSTPTFSSSVEAKKYIKFMEYQDLDLMAINSTIANSLNNPTGQTSYVKAPKETRNAAAGQLWIRYKKATWTSATGANGWAFYYYGEGDVEDGINLSGLSGNLSGAIDEVTNRIVSNGGDLYLVGEDNQNPKTGAPYLPEEMLHVSEERAAKTMNGISFVSPAVYRGDASIYQNNVSLDSGSYPIGSNLAFEVTNATKLYYRSVGADDWTPLIVKDGQTLRNVLPDSPSGLYEIREYGPNGVGEFTVYLDQALPTLKIIINEGLSGQKEDLLDGSITTITCQTVTLVGLLGEDDPYSYVAIYSYPGRTLQKVLYGNEVKNYVLKDGNYYLEVGDRSGNVITYRILTSATEIDWSIYQNDSGTAVIVKTNNRTESEIYSYEVYLNEVLIDTEFAPLKIYRNAGYYRVVITDIYKTDSPVTKVLTYEAPAPDMTWQYMNEDGSYSTYDPNKPVKMVLTDDEAGTRTTNVLSSTLVRIIFNDVGEKEIEFEVTGLQPGDYSYNETTGRFVVNTLTSWTLRVWYKNQPENDHLFVFSIDADAPGVTGSFIGQSFRPYVVTEDPDPDDPDAKIVVVETSSFDFINLDKYKTGASVVLDTLSYETLDQGALAFENGNVISGNRIVLLLTDASGIRTKDLYVTRNGVKVDVELNSNNELVLTGYGTYVVVVVDNLGNTARFVFTNVEGSTSNATVDGKAIGQDAASYGHEALEIETLYEGVNTFLITAGEKAFAYEFHYEGGVLTYGSYIVMEEKIGEAEDAPVEKYVEYFQAHGFSIDKSTLNNFGVWYLALENDRFTIHVMIDEAGNAHYRVASLGDEISVETRFETGRTHLPERYIAFLATTQPELVFLTDGDVAEKLDSLEYIYVNGLLTIDESKVASSIIQIECKFTIGPDSDDKTVTSVILMEGGEWKEHLKGEELGYYRVSVKNKYGNEAVYLIRKIETFASEAVIHTLDGQSVTFSEHEGTIYSNYSIELIVFSTEVEFEINGVRASGVSQKNHTVYTLDRNGVYHVVVLGTNGIRDDYDFEIATDDNFVAKDEWITGWNEEALLHSEGYTNTLCSIELGEDVVFVDMKLGDGERVILYDAITGTGKTDVKALKEVIGSLGVGKYTISFRNKYGDLVTKTVHYNNVPSIILSRAIVSDPNSEQIYDLDLAVRKGFYSNYILYFSTTSSAYVFTINGVEYRLDEKKAVEFTNISGKGSFSYTVTYLDEYGNYVEFEAILSREDVTFDTSSMETITVGSTLYTRDDIKITFGADLKATLSVDGRAAVDYVSGTTRFADGTYTFVVRDIAGNNVTFTIVHKSVNHYTLRVVSTGEDVIDGGVVNDSNVVFNAEDGSSIKYVIRNGELINELSSYTFSLTGHYELLIEDMIGNRSYEEFTILKNSLATFTYTAPFDYEVTEVWRVGEDGSRDLLNLKGKTITLTENGDYLVVVTSTKTASYFNFTVGIDNSAPTAKLVGAEDGGVTARDVTLSGLHTGDVVRIYKDGVLVSETTVTVSTMPPSITTGGKYRIVITNVQGVTLEFSFTRNAITNVPGSIFIIVFSALLIAAVGIGLTYRTKLKTDD